MSILTKILLGGCLTIAITFQANALSINPLTPTVPGLVFSSNSQSSIDAAINAHFTLEDPALVYKMNLGGPEEGSFAARA